MKNEELLASTCEICHQHICECCLHFIKGIYEIVFCSIFSLTVMQHIIVLSWDDSQIDVNLHRNSIVMQEGDNDRLTYDPILSY